MPIVINSQHFLPPLLLHQFKLISGQMSVTHNGALAGPVFGRLPHQKKIGAEWGLMRPTSGKVKQEWDYLQRKKHPLRYESLPIIDDI